MRNNVKNSKASRKSKYTTSNGLRSLIAWLHLSITSNKCVLQDRFRQNPHWQSDRPFSVRWSRSLSQIRDSRTLLTMDLEVLRVELKQILHLKVGCSDFGPVRDRGSSPNLITVSVTSKNKTQEVEIVVMLGLETVGVKGS